LRVWHSLCCIQCKVGSFEEYMTSETICPYYGKNDDQCDVGCGYISTYDVNMIIRYCRGRHLQCVKYLELSERFSMQNRYGAEVY
jgi:hypothetical protein